MRRLAPLLALLLLLFLNQTVTAQSTIDRGNVTFTNTFSTYARGQFNFEGPQMTLKGELMADIFRPPCGPCLAGQQITVGAQMSFGTACLSGIVTINNVEYKVDFDSSLNMSSTSVTLPTRYSRLPFKVFVPVTAQGNIKAFTHNSSNLLFTFPVNLNGTATLTLQLEYVPPSGPPSYKVKKATFEFLAAEKSEKN